MECKLVVGQKVICVIQFAAARGYRSSAGETFPELDKIYTVRELDHGHADDGTYDVGIRLVEIVNPVMRYKRDERAECAFWHGAFRPVKDSRLDVFRRLLEPLPAQERQRLGLPAGVYGPLAPATESR